MARGKALDVFEDHQRLGKQRGYTFEARPNIDTVARRMHEAFASKATGIDAFVESLAGLNTEQTEIIATLYAAWNDLLADGEDVTDDKLFAAFYAWHPNKRSFQEGQLRLMKQWMLGDGIVPRGRAKRTKPLAK